MCCQPVYAVWQCLIFFGFPGHISVVSVQALTCTTMLLLHHFWFVKVDGPADARDLGSPSPFGSSLSFLPSYSGARDQWPDASTTELPCCCVSLGHPGASSVPATHHQDPTSFVLFLFDVREPPLPASNSVKFATVVGMRGALMQSYRFVWVLLAAAPLPPGQQGRP